jgi:hypothetical protein
MWARSREGQMNTFSYRVYYEYFRTISDPIPVRKSKNAVTYALDRFPIELEHCLPEEATLSKSPVPLDSKAIIVCINTPQEDSETDEVVKKCLASVGLYGEKMTRSEGH